MSQRILPLSNAQAAMWVGTFTQLYGLVYVRSCRVLRDRGSVGANCPASLGLVQRDAVIIASNPLGKVPTFFKDDSQVLYDSRVICEYLGDLAGGTVFPHCGKSRWQALTLQSLSDGKLDAALLARYEDVARPENLRWLAWCQAQLGSLFRRCKMVCGFQPTLVHAVGLVYLKASHGHVAVAWGAVKLQLSKMQLSPRRFFDFDLDAANARSRPA